MGHIQKQQAKGHGRILPPQEPKSTNSQSPVFCLRYLKNGYGLADCGPTEATALIHQMKLLCEKTWQEIQNARRQSFGHEKMPLKQLKCEKPARVTDDVKELLVFRFDGGPTARFLGLRHDRVFEVYIIDHEGKTYDHGA